MDTRPDNYDYGLSTTCFDVGFSFQREGHIKGEIVFSFFGNDCIEKREVVLKPLIAQDPFGSTCGQLSRGVPEMVKLYRLGTHPANRKNADGRVFHNVALGKGTPHSYEKLLGATDTTHSPAISEKRIRIRRALLSRRRGLDDKKRFSQRGVRADGGWKRYGTVRKKPFDISSGLIQSQRRSFAKTTGRLISARCGTWLANAASCRFRQLFILKV
ncbi:hypothetical protein EDD18DRAFT_1116374 [Armillaria luteobubalina]|uniref:Uncharacterized protein n=1 Tax=Armillaria luteobubalina TaxID=153913 RepID=A0AA39NZQ6_9AGAR|nr:hypothetical protein EDD18DRAFT_1116374 [Armillaria luteobubalina]